MVRRVAVAVLGRLTWSPPGVDLAAWRLALAEDVVDVLATLAEVEAAVAVEEPDRGLLAHMGWPGMRRYVGPTLDAATIFAAAAADGFDQAVLLAADAPDLPGMLIAKLLRPLTSHPVAAAPATSLPSESAALRDANPTVDEAMLLDESDAPTMGLLGLSAALPAPDWLPAAGLDDLTPRSLRRHAPRAADVSGAPGWHRLRGPDDLRRLDPRLVGWEATRALLTTGPRGRA